MKTFYIFLDIDGVLNNKNHYKKQHKKYGGRFICEDMPFNPRSLKNLKKIIQKTNAKIVLSSSWRNTTNGMIVLKSRLTEYGIKIFDKTPYINGERGKEIRQWCKEKTKKGDKILIIDDEMYDILNYFDNSEIVKINWNKGLTLAKTIEAVIKIKEK